MIVNNICPEHPLLIRSSYGGFLYWSPLVDKSSSRNKLPFDKDAHKRLADSYRGGLREAIKRTRKGLSTDKSYVVKVLGCPIDMFITTLESKWKEGMSWENWGIYRVNGPRKWHIDHIRPCASFDLTDLEQQNQCFHWTNLQPLWAEENIKKGSIWQENT